MVDPVCISPMKYNQLEILNGIIGKSSVRITVEDALRHKTWSKVNAVVDTSGLDDRWRKDFTQGAQQLLKGTWVTATDPHYERILDGERGRVDKDVWNMCAHMARAFSTVHPMPEDAKVFPHLHPYGTGAPTRVRPYSGNTSVTPERA